MNTPYDFGEKLKNLRKSRGYTQKRLAEALELTVTAVSKYELNQSPPPLDTLRSISAIFNISIDELLGTEKSETISVMGLSSSQTEIVGRLINSFRIHNAASNKKLSPENCALLGEIVEELAK